LVVEASIIAHPARINGVVLPGFVAVHLFLSRSDDDIATGCTTSADAFRFLKKPDAHLEPEIFGRERADRTEIHRVESVIVIESLSWVRHERAIAAPLRKTERIIAHDVFA